MKTQLFIFFICILFLFGCATKNPTSATLGHFKDNLSVFERATPTVDETKNFKFEKIAFNKKHFFRITKDDQVFEFDSGRSFFKAFEIPTDNEIINVRLKSFAVEDNFRIIGKIDYYIFYPFIAFLDSNMNFTRATTPEMLISIGIFNMFNFENGGLEMNFTIDQKEFNEKYIVVYTKEKYIDDSESVVIGSNSTFYNTVPGGGGSVMVIPSDVDTTFSNNDEKASPFGQLRITLSPQQ
ncbi:MAG TPA: MalM family protein [Desulfuromonadales bacterium]|nr:MalM family protein [Desulfuromonadales bacterium]